MSTVIAIENLGKKYTLNHQARQESYVALRDVLTQGAKNVVGRLLRPFHSVPPLAPHHLREEFWALKDVSFEVKQGDRIGIIGRNGAGKSTLLKILSRISEPTTGSVRIRGRVASLLEVGTGFHPELTGRENIFLNGAILGMGRAEIKQKFDEIVDFAEIEKFLDTPVKRYSSGMYVRLAFAVAAHLEPEVLVVDEVLAVGDAAFQKKCLGKMEDAATKEGRTVLFVSHNLTAVRDLCTKGIWLESGALKHSSNSTNTIDCYLKSVNYSDRSGACKLKLDEAKEFQLTRVRLLSDEGQQKEDFTCDEPVHIVLDCLVRETVPGLYGYMSIERTDGCRVLESDSYDIKPNRLDELPCGNHTIKISIPPRSLGVGDYRIYLNFTSLLAKNDFNVDSPGHVLAFHLDDPHTQRGNNRNGYFSTCLKWDVA